MSSFLDANELDNLYYGDALIATSTTTKHYLIK